MIQELNRVAFFPVQYVTQAPVRESSYLRLSGTFSRLPSSPSFYPIQSSAQSFFFFFFWEISSMVPMSATILCHLGLWGLGVALLWVPGLRRDWRISSPSWTSDTPTALRPLTHAFQDSWMLPKLAQSANGSSVKHRRMRLYSSRGSSPGCRGCYHPWDVGRDDLPRGPHPIVGLQMQEKTSKGPTLAGPHVRLWWKRL